MLWNFQFWNLDPTDGRIFTSIFDDVYFNKRFNIFYPRFSVCWSSHQRKNWLWNHGVCWQGIYTVNQVISFWATSVWNKTYVSDVMIPPYLFYFAEVFQSRQERKTAKMDPGKPGEKHSALAIILCWLRVLVQPSNFPDCHWFAL